MLNVVQKECFITCLLKRFEDFGRIKHRKNEMLDRFMSLVKLQIFQVMKDRVKLTCANPIQQTKLDQNHNKQST